MMLRDGTCVCNASQNLFKDASSLEHAIPNSVKFGASKGYLPSNCQFFNLKASEDDVRDRWEHRDILAFSSLHAHPPSAAGFPHITPCSHTSTSSSNGDPAATRSSTGQTSASPRRALHSQGDRGARSATTRECFPVLPTLTLVISALLPPCRHASTTALASGCR